MANDELVSYIQKELRKGISSDSIRPALLKAGHKQEKINEAFAYVNHRDVTAKVAAMAAFLVIIAALIIVNRMEPAAESQAPSEHVFRTNDIKTNAEIVGNAVNLRNPEDYIQISIPEGSFSKLVITARAEQFIADVNEVTKWKEMSKAEYIDYVKANPPEKFKGEKLNDYIEYIKVYGKEPFMVAVETMPSRKMVWPYIGVSLGSSNTKIRLDSLQFNNYNIDIREVQLSKARIQLLDEYDTLRNVYINEIKLLR